MKGSVIFFADLIRSMKTPLELDFMAVSSYGTGTASSGALKVRKDLTTDIAGRDVLIVEDIIDSGNTLYNLKKLLNSRAPASVNIVTLLDKPERREVPMEPGIHLLRHRGRNSWWDTAWIIPKITEICLT